MATIAFDIDKHKKKREYRNLEEYKKQRSLRQKLVWENPDYRKKLVASHSGKPDWSHPNWKGEKASYVSKHHWVYRHFGAPQCCEKCGTTEKRKYHWSNKSGKYKRERSDWQRLCVPCHSDYDKGRKKTLTQTP